MASGYSVYAANLINDHILKSSGGVLKGNGGDVNVPSSFWIALFTSGAATHLRNNLLSSAVAYEPTGGSYARLEVKGSTGRVFSASSQGLAENTATWAFTAASGNWGTIVTAALVDVSSGSAGNVWYYGDLLSGKSVTTPDIFRFLAGALDIQL